MTLNIFSYACMYYGIIYNSQDIETTKVSIERWLDKDITHTHTRMEYYSAIKMKYCHVQHDGSWGYYAKWSKTERKGQKLYDFTHVEYKTKKNTWTKQKLHRYRQENGGYQKKQGKSRAKWVNGVKYMVMKGN